MDRSFSVSIGGNAVGKVTVRTIGLYYQFLCRCHLSGEIIYRLKVTCGSIQQNLGILVPESEGFILNTKVAIKRIGEGEMSFTLVSQQEKERGTFIPICPEEPFSYISRLKESFLIRQNGCLGIQIAKMQE